MWYVIYGLGGLYSEKLWSRTLKCCLKYGSDSIYNSEVKILFFFLYGLNLRKTNVQIFFEKEKHLRRLPRNLCALAVHLYRSPSPGASISHISLSQPLRVSFYFIYGLLALPSEVIIIWARYWTKWLKCYDRLTYKVVRRGALSETFRLTKPGFGPLSTG